MKTRKMNPPTEIYRQVKSIVAVKGPGHRCDAACKRARHTYIHKFNSTARVYGLPDGSLRIGNAPTGGTSTARNPKRTLRQAEGGGGFRSFYAVISAAPGNLLLGDVREHRTNRVGSVEAAGKLGESIAGGNRQAGRRVAGFKIVASTRPTGWQS